MNRHELVTLIAERCGLAMVDADRVVTAFSNTIIDEIESGHKVAIFGFGTSPQAIEPRGSAVTTPASEFESVLASVRFAPASAYSRDHQQP